MSLNLNTTIPAALRTQQFAARRAVDLDDPERLAVLRKIPSA